MQVVRVAMLASMLCAHTVVAVARASDSPAVDAASQLLVDAARADLARRLDIPADQVAATGFERVVWPDAGMGCPKPGIAYAQVQRDGYRIRLEANGRHYWYHGGGRRAPFLCDNPRNPPASKTPDQRV